MDIKEARKNVIEQQIRPWGGLKCESKSSAFRYSTGELCARGISKTRICRY